MRRRMIMALSAVALGCGIMPADVSFNAPGAMNPVIPGYFADPTLKKFGDTYYMYATTDGSGAGFGPAQLWQSKDLVNWTLMPMNWPDSHWIWAPDVMLNDNDGKYYYVYCQPCQIHVGVGDTPRGPWRNILGESEAVLVPDRFVKNAITLDGQTFVDDDGSVYMYWGTWGIYDGFGCGAGKLTPDMKGFTETRLIPNTEVTDFFEAPFVMKKDGVYYFMYSSGSCHDDTYRVQYAVSDKPLGPYEYKGCILATNNDGTVHGPGHHSILQEGDDYYIVYHRHDNPHSNRGFHRQVCIDRLEFSADGTIKPVVPTHEGIGRLLPSSVRSTDLAYGKKVTASSAYDDSFRPEYAVDANNGTLWRPAGMGQEWIEIDLGKEERIKTVLTQWEYGTQFYQYFIETSFDGKNWNLYADKRGNRLAGSPMVDFGDTSARYVRITFTGGEKAGFPGALWNVKVYPETEDSAPQMWVGLSASDWDGMQWNNNNGQLGGALRLLSGRVTPVRYAGRDGLELAPGTVMRFDNPFVNAKRAHTATAAVYAGGRWIPYDLEKCLDDEGLTVRAGDIPLVITDIRYYNWKQTETERSHDSMSAMPVRNPASKIRKGLVVDIDADVFNVGDTVAYLPNGKAGGYFEPIGEPATICEIDGRKGLAFDGRQIFRSAFMLPESMRDNCPYTLEMTIFNPEMAENECVADFTTSHDELEKVMAVNGTEPRCGMMQHYGWYEDAGWKDAVSKEGKWQNIYVCFDGRIERVYVDDELISEKDIQLLVKPSQFVTIGRNNEGEWPFTGYIRNLKLFDEYIPKNL